MFTAPGISSHLWNSLHSPSESSWLLRSLDTIVPVVTPFLADLYGSMEGLELSKTTAVFSHDVACTAPSNTMKAS